MGVHKFKFGLLRGPAERYRKSCKNRKLIATWGMVALLVLGGVGVLIGNTFAAKASDTTWQKGSIGTFFVSASDLESSAGYTGPGQIHWNSTVDVIRVEIDSVLLERDMYEWYDEGLNIYHYAMNNLSVGQHTLGVRWATSEIRLTSNYGFTVTEETPEYFTRTLSFDANGGSGAPTQTTCNSTNSSCSVEIPNTRPTRTNYDFLGWADENTASVAAYQPGATITLASDKIVYAVWKLSSTEGPAITPSSGEYRNGSETGITFTPETNTSTVSGVTVDGNTVPEGSYTVDSTTGAVTILPAYLDTLADGTHTVNVIWADGKISSTTIVTSGKSGGGADTGPVIVPSDTNYEKGNGTGIEIVPSENKGNPTAVYVDGKLVDPQYYSVNETTGAVTIKPEYLDTLKDGEHKIAITWKDGTTSSVTVKTSGNSDKGVNAVVGVPETGINGNSNESNTNAVSISGGILVVVIAGILIASHRRRSCRVG